MESTQEAGKIVCRCPEDFEGSECEDYVRRRPVFGPGGESTFESVLFVLLICAAVIVTVGYVFFKKREFKSSQSVLFRNGSNVEFTAPPFMASLGHHDEILLQDTMNNHDSGFDFSGGGSSSIGGGSSTLGSITKASTTDFSNPMYDVASVGGSSSNIAPLKTSTSTSKSQDLMSSGTSQQSLQQQQQQQNQSGAPANLIANPIKSNPSKDSQFRSIALSPSSVETDKDTQMLVEEDHMEDS